MSVIIYSLPNCQPCKMTKRKLTELGIPYAEVDLSDPMTSDKADGFARMGHTAAPVVEVIKDHNVHETFSGYQPERLGRIQ